MKLGESIRKGGSKVHMKSFEFFIIEKQGEEVQREKIIEEIGEYLWEDSHKNPMRVERISEMIDLVNAILNYLEYVPDVVLEQVQREHTQKIKERGFKNTKRVRIDGDVEKI